MDITAILQAILYVAPNTQLLQADVASVGNAFKQCNILHCREWRMCNHTVARQSRTLKDWANVWLVDHARR